MDKGVLERQHSGSINGSNHVFMAQLVYFIIPLVTTIFFRLREYIIPA